MTGKLSIRDLSIKGKKVLMRVDFNVPLDKEGRITDDTRILSSLPSIRYVLDQGGALILMSHLGRPKDKVVPELSLKACANRLSEILHMPVEFSSDCIGSEAKKLADRLSPGQVLLLENLRFHRGEEHPDEDPGFVKQLADLGDVYVNDAFGTSHRAHASTTLIASYFPSKAAAGFLLEKEIEFLGAALSHPKRPFYAIVGGAKISTKIGVLKALLKKTDALLVGGAMAYTFFRAQGIEIGKSLCEEDQVAVAKTILEEAESSGIEIFLPIDNVVTKQITQGASFQVVDVEDGIPSDQMGVDIGPQTIELFSNVLAEAGTILWNGPLGVFEVPPFDKGTNEIAHTISRLTAVTIVGGGDSVAAIQATGAAEKITHISTGGGASLEYIELGTLPGIEALSAAP